MAAGQRLTAHAAAGHAGAAPAAARVAGRAGLAVDAARAEQLADHQAALVGRGADPAAAVVGFHAQLARRSAVRGRHADAQGADPAAAILPGRTDAAAGRATPAAAEAAHTAERAAGAGARARLAVRRTAGRIHADQRARPGRIRRADERIAVRADRACRPLRTTGRERAAPGHARSRAAVAARGASAAVCDAVDARQRPRDGQLDVAPAARRQRRQRHPDRDRPLQGGPSPTSRWAAGAASPRGNSRR